MIFQLLAAFCATFAFVVLMNVPMTEAYICGFVGVLSWGIYLLITKVDPSAFYAVFAAALASAFVSRVLAPVRRMPRTIFIVAAIIPLVPGTYLYRMMYSILMSDMVEAAFYGTQTLIVAGIISISIVMVLSLPDKLIIFIDDKIRKLFKA